MQQLFGAWESPSFQLGQRVTEKRGEKRRGEVVGYYGWNKPILLYAVVWDGEGEAAYIPLSELKVDKTK